MPDRVSIIVPTFNRAALLPEALDSLLAQTRPPDEIIVVDDGSSDRTPDVCRSYGDTIRYIRKSNAGKATAVNLGLAEATGDWVWIVDDDDIATPRAIESYLDFLAQDASLDFAYAGHATFRTGSAGREIDAPRPPVERRGRELFLTLVLDDVVHPPTTFARLSCFRSLGGFDEALIRSQDYDLILRMAHRFYGAPLHEVTLLFRQHEGVRGTQDNPIKAADRRINWQKYGQMIFRRLYAEVPLEAYAGGDDAARTSDRWQREALLRRAAAMVRNSLFEEAIADLQRLSGLERARARTELTLEEKAICLKALAIRFEHDYAGGTRAIRTVLRRGLSSAATGSIRYAMAKGVLYELMAHARRKDWNAARHFLLRLVAACASWPVLRAALASKGNRLPQVVGEPATR